MHFDRHISLSQGKPRILKKSRDRRLPSAMPLKEGASANVFVHQPTSISESRQRMVAFEHVFYMLSGEATAFGDHQDVH